MPFRSDIQEEEEIENIISSNEEPRDKHRKELNKVKNVFRNKPSLTAKIECKINTGNVKSIFQNPYLLAKDEAEKVQELIQEISNEDLIELSDLPWAWPIALIKKKD